MLNALLGSEQTRFADLGEVSVYALIGYLVVFVGIAFLIWVVWMVGKVIFKQKVGTEKEEKTEAVKTDVSADSAPLTPKDEELSEEVVAVITAAIMAYYEKNHPKCDFVVKRIKRI